MGNKIIVLLAYFVTSIIIVQAGFFTFYFPNAFKPSGFNELSSYIDKLDDRMNETRDEYADAVYFWGQMQEIDSAMEEAYPEESACEEVFPLFRDLAIEYAQIDYSYYMEPMIEYRDYLVARRDEWYPLGLESKAALPREWEQKLLDHELSIRISRFEELTNEQQFRELRSKMLDIWKKVRRNLDHSLPCIYLRYAYRQIAEDISQVALEANLDGMKRAYQVLNNAYKRIEKFKKSDEAIIAAIQEEIEKEQRYKISA